MKKRQLVSRINFAERCGVTPTSITRICKTSLRGAIVGKRIDISHPSAVEYLAIQESAHDETVRDPRYEDVARWCLLNNRYNITAIVSSGIVGRVRAKRILAELTGGAEKSSPQTSEDQTEIAPDVAPRPPKPDPPSATGWTARNEAKKKVETATVDIPDNIQAFADWTLREIIVRFGSDAMFVDFLKALKEIESINEKRLKNAQTERTLVSRELVEIIIDVVDSAMRKLLTAGSKKIARMAYNMTKAGEEIEAIEDEVKDQVGQYVKNIKVKSDRTLNRG
jgi:hypothetical protein